MNKIPFWKLIVLSFLIAIPVTAIYQYFSNQYSDVLGVYCKDVKHEEQTRILVEYPPVNVNTFVAESELYPVNYSDEEVTNILEGTKNIWKHYNVDLELIGPIQRTTFNDTIVHISDFNSQEVYNLAESVLSSKLADKTVDIIFVKEFRYDFWDHLIFLSLGNSEAKTWRGLKNVEINGIKSDAEGLYLIVISKQDTNQSWNLAHEFGHVLGLVHTKGPNLMTDDCYKEKEHPIVLNENQINEVEKTIRGILV